MYHQKAGATAANEILRPESFCVSSGEAQRSDPHYIRIQIEFHQLLADIFANRQLETDGAKRKQN
jgi:hypothetical protein